MSIDREIALRERLYGNNPQGLMQRYGMTQDTLDLLALMKVKKDQEAAKRQLQASMQQQPGTVKEQAEQQLVAEARNQMGAGMNDRVQQVGGAMRQQQAQQAQAMQRLAQSAQRPGGNPMMSGIAAVPAPNMRMAQGGVVGYAGPDGSLVTTEEDPMMLVDALDGSPMEQRALLAQEIDRQIEELGGSQRGRIGSTRALPQEAQERIARINELERDKLRLLAAGRDPEKIRATVDAVAGRMPYSTRPVGEMAERALPADREGRSSEDIASMIEAAMGVRQAPQLTPTMEMQEPSQVQDMGGAGVLLPPGAQTVAAAPASTSSPGGFFSPSGPGSALAGGTRAGPSASAGSSSGAVAPGVVTRGPLAGLQALTANTDIENDPRVKAATERLRSREATQEGAYGAPKAERTAAREEVDAYLRRKEFEDAEKARIAALKAAQAQTPEELADERRRAFLLGSSGRSRGFAASGASAGLANILAAQRARKIGDLEKLQEMERGLEARDIGIGKEGISAAKTAEEQAALGLRGLTSAASAEQVATINTAADMAKLQFQRDEANQAAYIENAKLAQQSAQDAIRNANDNLERLQAERKNIQDQVNNAFASLTQGQDYQRAVNTLREGKPVTIDNLVINSETELQQFYLAQALNLINESMGGGNQYKKTLTALEAAISRLTAPPVTARTAI